MKDMKSSDQEVAGDGVVETAAPNRDTFKKMELIAISFVVLIVGISLWFVLQDNDEQANEQPAIKSYEECVAAGYPVMESYPEQCQVPHGDTFTRQLTELEQKLNNEDAATVDEPQEEQFLALEVPESCVDYAHDSSGSKPKTVKDLRSGIADKWQGCVTTPLEWSSGSYLISIEFNVDGTYQANLLDKSNIASPNTIDSAMYYGTDGGDMSRKTYSIDSIDDLQDNGLGRGRIELLFSNGDTNSGTLQNILLSGNSLEFEFFHRHQFGPIIFQLVRVNQ